MCLLEDFADSKPASITVLSNLGLVVSSSRVLAVDWVVGWS